MAATLAESDVHRTQARALATPNPTDGRDVCKKRRARDAGESARDPKSDRRARCLQKATCTGRRRERSRPQIRLAGATFAKRDVHGTQARALPKGQSAVLSALFREISVHATSALPRLRPGRGRVWERVWPPKRGPFLHAITITILGFSSSPPMPGHTAAIPVDPTYPSPRAQVSI